MKSRLGLLTIIPVMVWAWVVQAADTKLAAGSQDRDAECVECHDEMEAKPILSIYQTRHGVRADPRTPACRDCHGESQAHARKDHPKSTPRPPSDVPFSKVLGGAPIRSEQTARVDAVCLSCHSSGSQHLWQGGRHESQGLSCVNCHVSHAPKDAVLIRKSQAETCYKCHQTQRAQSHQLSRHPLSGGEVACTDCHNPHGTVSPKLLTADSVNDNCYTCHAEKRGPFLWSHAPVDDNCLNCHAPHGANNAWLLKARSPWLCQQCHSSPRHASRAYSATTGTAGSIGASVNSSTQLALRGCVNCHSQVHGSNHPAGGFFLR